jgi:hypothetical protein
MFFSDWRRGLLDVFYFEDFVENPIVFSKPDQMKKPVAVFMPQRMVQGAFLHHDLAR